MVCFGLTVSFLEPSIRRSFLLADGRVLTNQKVGSGADIENKKEHTMRIEQGCVKLCQKMVPFPRFHFVWGHKCVLKDLNDIRKTFSKKSHYILKRYLWLRSDLKVWVSDSCTTSFSIDNNYSCFFFLKLIISEAKPNKPLYPYVSKIAFVAIHCPIWVSLTTYLKGLCAAMRVLLLLGKSVLP